MLVDMAVIGEIITTLVTCQSFLQMEDGDDFDVEGGGDIQLPVGVRRRSVSRKRPSTQVHGPQSSLLASAIPEDDALFAVQDDEFSVFAKVTFVILLLYGILMHYMRYLIDRDIIS